MSNVKPPCPNCGQEEPSVFNRMDFATTETRKVIVGYLCGSCDHSWQVYYTPEDAPQK